MMDARLLVTCSLLLLSLGCATPQSDSNSELSAFHQYHRQTAQELLARGELYAARTHLQIILLTNQDSIAVQNEVNLLSQLIASQVTPQISQARQQLKKGQAKNAQKTLLKVLAADPSNAEAFNLLRQVTHMLRRHKQGDETLTRYTQLKLKPVATVKPSQPLPAATVIAKPAPKTITPAKEATAERVEKVDSTRVTKNAASATDKQPAHDKPLTAQTVVAPAPDSKPSRQVEARAPQKSKTSQPPSENKNMSVTQQASVAPPAKPLTDKKPEPVLLSPPEPDKITMLAAPHLSDEALPDSEPLSKTVSPVEAINRANETETDKENAKKTDQQATYLARFWRLYNQKDYAELIKAADTKPTDIPLPIEFEIWLSDAHIALANIHQGKGDYLSAIAEANKALAYPDPENRAQETLINLKQQYAESLYKQGQKLLHSDLDQAIALWEMALNYNEEMAETRHQLQRAYLIRKNLGSIRDNNLER